MLELKSTVVTLKNLLMLNFDEVFSNFVMPTKTKLSIPDYQREYKWEKAKIKTFVDNVMQRSKFLGIITTEVSTGECLSVVDGQQRLTTVILMLSQLYNFCADENETETQTEIQELISSQINDRSFFKLENESVGTYLHFVIDGEGRQKINVEIDSTKDIYKQASKFKEACEIIQDALTNRDRTITLDSYKQRLVDCELLLFSQKNTANMQQGSSEEIYIDINEKAQSLDPEDIFKGHCFAICKTDDQQSQVKTLWRSIKQNFFAMDNIFKKTNMGIFLHYYLLTQEATKTNHRDIKQDLTINGENIVVHNYNTPTRVIALLNSIRTYQLNLLLVADNLKVINNRFPQIMTTTPQVLGNNTTQIKEANIIIGDILDCAQDLFKLPLFFLIDKNCAKDTANKLSYQQFSSFIYLYYVYMFLFSRIKGSRKRGDLPSQLIYHINSGQGFLIQFIKEIVDYADNFTLDSKAINNTIVRRQLYNILDNFKSTATTTPTSDDGELSFKFGLFPESYNLEHLIINQSSTINWRSQNGTEYQYSKVDFETCEHWNNRNNKWGNFIWIDGAFNRDELKNKDIINKIILLRGSIIASDDPTQGTNVKKHSHIETICQRIMRTEGFRELVTAHYNNESRIDVLAHYRTFIEKYFSDEYIDTLRAEFETKFKKTLDDLSRLVQ